MRIVVVTVHPKLVDAYAAFGVFRAAAACGAATVRSVDLRDFAVDTHATVDGAPYGGGDGMVLRPEPLRDALQSISTERSQLHVVMPSPGGILFTQSTAQRLAAMAAGDSPGAGGSDRLMGVTGKTLVFVCGRFAGVDQRFIDLYVDEELSAGDFVVSGGELPALMMIDATLRLLPGVLGNSDSAVCDSFAEGMDGMLEYPLYTRPPEFEGVSVPDVLLSGDHKKISKWRQEESRARTKRRRPDLLR